MLYQEDVKFFMQGVMWRSSPGPRTGKNLNHKYRMCQKILDQFTPKFLKNDSRKSYFMTHTMKSTYALFKSR